MGTRRFARFISDNLPVAPVPGVPELSLHMATRSSGLGRIATDAPYFAWPWAGGLALARYLLDDPGLAAGRRVLDLGAGSGLVGIAAATCGARVACAETDPAAVAAIGLNAALNGVEIDIIDRDVTAEPPADAGLVLCGDVFYAPAVAARMLAYLDRCAAAGIAILVGDPGRADLPTHRLRLLASRQVADFGGGRAAVEAGIYAFAPERPAAAPLARSAESSQEWLLPSTGSTS